MTTIEIITDLGIAVGCCPTAWRHAVDAGHEVIGVAVIHMGDPEDGYSADETDAELTARLGVDCGTYSEGDDTEDGSTVYPIVSL